MVTIGADSHKRTHTFVALDDVGRRLGTKTVKTNSDGHLEIVRWSAQFSGVGFALEDCRHLTRRLEADLLTAGCRVVRVPTNLMAGARRATREPGKSDPIDAEAAAFDGVVARLARGLLARCAELNLQINLLEKELRDLVRQLAPSLLDIPGCGVLSAAVIIGETAGVHRFADKDKYARFTGTAPPPCRSGPAPAPERSDSTAVATGR